MADRELEIRESYIEEIARLEARIKDGGVSEATLERRRADAACKRAAKSEAERDQLRQQVERLISYIAAHLDNGDCVDHLFIERVDQVRKELGE